MPKLHPAQFQFVVTMRVKKGTRPTRAQVREQVEHWIEGTPTIEGFKCQVIIWNGSSERTITEFDYSSKANATRSDVLKSILQRGLPRATFRVNPMGGG